MLPCFATYDRAYGLLGDTKEYRYLIVRIFAPQANPFNVILCELAAAMSRSSGINIPTFSVSIIAVVFMCSQEQVRWIYA